MTMTRGHAAQIKTTVDDPARVERRRAQLTQAAIACFSDKGYHATTIRDVAERAEVSTGLIYQYIGDKEDLLFLALCEVLDEYERQIPAALEGIDEPLRRLHTAVRTHCRVHESRVAATVLAYRETKSLSRARREEIKQKELATNELIAACVRECTDSGLMTDMDVDMFVYQIVMFSHMWALKAWHFHPRMTVETYIETGLKLMLRGVLTGVGERTLRALEAEAAN